MWNDKRSLLLSKIFTTVLLAAVVCLLVAGPVLVRWLMSFTLDGLNPDFYGLFLATLYCGGAIACVLLILLYILLDNISKDIVFERANKRLLRYLSWCCFGGGFVGLVSGLYYFPWVLLGAAALFAGLIVRVVKNLLARAIVLKEENELTI